ncbi:MAG: IS200/IS605 family transposase [Gammaproteobacteria bacterium]
MKNSTQFRRGRHIVFNMHAHLVFVTKYRRQVFSEKILKATTSIFSEVCKDFDAELLECNGEADHVHLLINYPPKISISKLVNSLKGVSSRILRKTFPEIQKFYWKGVFWSPSYFAASCGGAPLDILKQYIEQQKSPP